MADIIAGASAMVVVIVALLLILDPNYRDSLLERLALSGIALASVARVMDLVTNGRPVSPIGVLLWTALALFLTRHFWEQIKASVSRCRPCRRMARRT